MAKLNALIEALRETAREEWADTVLDDIVSSRDEDDSIFHEKISTLEAGNAELTSQISSLKNELYDISKLIPKQVEEVEEVEEELDDDPDADPIDDFFTEEED